MDGHLFLESACKKYGLWYSKSASGICHQLHIENFAVPGATILGANSHTTNCGSIGALALGIGGMDAAVAMAGHIYYLSVPEIINVRLTGKLQEWCSAKDIVLELLRRLTVKGACGKILEFTGLGAASLNIDQRMTVTNMCVEMGAVTGIFPSDQVTRDYFHCLKRDSDWLELKPDENAQYDGEMLLELKKIEPLVALPGQPDNVMLVREAANTDIGQVIIGGCISGTYTDLSTTAAILKNRRINENVSLIIQPASRMVIDLLSQKRFFQDLIDSGAEVTPPTCDACVGIGYVPASGVNSLRTMSRNFTGRSGCKNDAVFLCSAETAAVSSLTGKITDPRDFGGKYGIPIQKSFSFYRFEFKKNPGLIPPANEKEAANIKINRTEYFVPTKAGGQLADKISSEVIIKLGDNISTDHIIPNGADIKAHRSDIEKLSKYMFFRLDSSFSDRTKKNGGGIIVAGTNFGQGSARENAAIVPMELGIKLILAKSFSDRYKKNLINFGIIPLLFKNQEDYEDIEQGDFLVLEDISKSMPKDEFVLANIKKNKLYAASTGLSDWQKEILMAGGMISYLAKLDKNNDKSNKGGVDR